MKTFEQRAHDAGKGDLFNYDELYRLNQVRMNSPEPQNPSTSQFEKSKSYTFDKVDNILKIVETQNGQTRDILTQVNNLNQYTQFDALNLIYDGNGNLQQKGNQHFTYDYRNRLVSVEDGINTTSFKYDVLGRRIEKTSTAGPAVRYYYDGYQVIEERDSSDQLQKQYIYGNGIDELLRMDKFSGATATTYYVHTNAIGSVTSVMDNDGNLVERVSYDDYGKPTFIDYLTDPQNPASSSTSIIGNNYLFQGREYDPETGLYNYRARYFDPQIARFLQTDPVGYQNSMNLYQGMNQNSINYADPYGQLVYKFDYAGTYSSKPKKGWLEKADFYKKYKISFGSVLFPIGSEYKSHTAVLSYPFSKLSYDIELRDGKFYPRFDIQMTVYIWMAEKESSDRIHRHEVTHLFLNKLWFIQALINLTKAESIGYRTEPEARAKAAQVSTENHPLSDPKIIPKEEIPQLNVFQIIWGNLFIGIEYEIYYYENKFNQQLIDAFINDFQKEYSRNTNIRIREFFKK